jgi:hypothetical protein
LGLTFYTQVAWPGIFNQIETAPHCLTPVPEVPMRHARLTALIPLVTVLACSDGNAPAATGLPAPALQTPRAEVPIRQNDPTTGCGFSPTHGYGFQVSFTWSPVPEAARYHIVLHHVGSEFPVLDEVVDSTAYLLMQCNAYVIDENRFGWHWSVAGLSPEGEEGTWAEERNYEFEAMTFPPESLP